VDVKKVDILEFLVVILSLLFIFVISAYHLSYNGFEGLTTKQWNVIWAIAENSISLLMASLVSIYSGVGTIRLLFKWIFIPYFIIKLIYHYSAFGQIYIISEKWWENIWSFICTFLLTIGVGYCLNLIMRNRKYVAKIFKF